MTKLNTSQVSKKLEQLGPPWALMLIGLPGSGKSTFIKSLRSRFDEDVVVLSTDDIIEARALAESKTYNQVFSEVSFSVFKAEMESKAAQARKEKLSVIFDQTNMSSKSRKAKLEPFLKAGYTCASLSFDVHPKVLHERLDKRAIETGKVIPVHVLHQMLSGYKTPTREEGFAHTWDFQEHAAFSTKA